MPSAAASEDDGVFFVTLGFRGGSYEVPVQTGDRISSIFDFVLEVPEMHDFPRENCKLICKGKVFRPDDIVCSDGKFKLMSGSKLMLMATSAHDLSYVRNSRADPLVKGFKEEERDEISRKKRAMAASMSAWGTKQDAKYRFRSIKSEFKFSTPSPYDAEKLLERLVTDPGIIEIMKTRQFEVGILTEMSPIEAQDRMAKKGTPGMDLLGYNQNAGEKIVLKLRTDSLKGFRPYHDLINTLIHEMTHNVWGPHDEKFWKLFGELKAQYMKFHRFWSHGGQAADSNSTGQFQGFATGAEEDEASSSFGHVLGGSDSVAVQGSLTDAERRERAILAAEARKVTGGIDFVNSGGKMIIVCPCGQVHNAGDCPMAGNADMDEDEDEDDDMEEEDMEVEVETAANHPPSNPSSIDEPAVLEAVEVAADVEIASSAPSRGPEHVREEVFQSSATAPQPEFEQGAQPSEEGPLSGLTIEDLEALGLGDAASWLQSFSGKLQALSSRTAHSTAKQAIEVLLQLVRNVVSNPDDAKFRRIKADNPKIRERLLAAGPEVEKLITLLGFEPATEECGRVFVLRQAAFDSARLQMGQDLLQRQLSSTVVAH